MCIVGFATDIAAGRAIDSDFHRGNSIYDWVYSGESRSIHYQSNFNSKQTKDRSQLNGTGLFIFDRLVELSRLRTYSADLVSNSSHSS
jgi:hypothetical protein